MQVIYPLINLEVPSLKLTAKAPENGWLELQIFPFGARPSSQELC